MLVIAILLIFCVVVRHKWRNAAAKKEEEEEFLRLVAVTAEEEAEIEKLQVVDGYTSPPLPPPQLEERNCAVCYSPTTTRCSQCKVVRYCSGKCQINHWRRGHKYECQPATSLHASKGSEYAVETTSHNQDETHISNEADLFPQREYEVDDSKTSSSSVPFFSSSPEQSETSFHASTSEFHDSGSPIRPLKITSEGIDSNSSRTTSESDETDTPKSPVNSVHVWSTPEANEIKREHATKSDEDFLLTESKVETTTGAGLEEIILNSVEMRTSPPSSSLTKFSSSENRKNQTLAFNGEAMKSHYPRGSSKHQLPNKELRNAQYSRSLSMSSSAQYWKDEGLMFSGRETRSMSFRRSENDQTVSTKSESSHSLVSEPQGAHLLPKSTSKGLKTSVRKFVQNFRASKQLKSYSFDMSKDSACNFSQEDLFPVKLFAELYSREPVELHPFGLTNCGNSCYANAVLQSLAFTRPVTSYFLQGLHSKKCRKKDWCLICEFELLIRKGGETNHPLSPVKILSQIQRIGSHLTHGREEDAHDFLRSLLIFVLDPRTMKLYMLKRVCLRDIRNMVEKMQSLWLEEAGVSGSLVEDSTLLGLTFGGYLRSKIKCMKCSGRSERCDRMMDLSVEIDGDIDTLDEALAQFTISETLGGDDKYKCSRCKSYEKAKKKLTVVEAPNILTVVLKRFRSGNSEKVNKLVQFPEVLNLAPYMSGTNDKYPRYDLYAVVVHLSMMNAAYNGHYISYVKDFKGQWFKIDDSRVSRVNLKTVLSVEAYMLFYARHNLRIPSSVMNSKIRRTTQAIPSSGNTRNRNSRFKPSSLESNLLHQQSEKQPYCAPPKDFFGNPMVESEDWFPSNHRNAIFDSSSDNSSIFSASDAGSYRSDSTKESSPEEISGYLFGYPR